MVIKHLLFDLDNTLYPSTSQMDKGISLRMNEAVADFFKVSVEQAKILRKENIIHHSTTLEWLRASGMNDIEGFFAYVHPENEADELQPQPELRGLLEKLPYSKSILTNAPAEHAVRVLEKLKVSDCFTGITDLRDAFMLGKPYPQAYEVALKKSGTAVENTIFIDDMQKYTDGWSFMGGTAVLIGSANGRPLAQDARAYQAFNGRRSENGRTFRLNSVYELPELLQKLEKE